MTSATSFAQLTGRYDFDPSHTRIGFVARHAMVTKVRGSFKDVTGTLNIDGENPAESTATVGIKAASVDTGNADRDAHLRSSDFLLRHHLAFAVGHGFDLGFGLGEVSTAAARAHLCSVGGTSCVSNGSHCGRYE